MRDADEPRTLVVDDHPLFVEGLLAVLRLKFKRARIDVCHSTDEAARRSQQSPFDLVILDISLPGPCPFGLAKKIVQGTPAKVVFISAFFNELNVKRALTAGALGLLSKHDGSSEVLSCVASVMAGKRAVSGSLSERFPIMDLQLQDEELQTQPKLSHREIEILSYVAAGHSTKEIAAITRLRVRTVDRHRSNIMDKTGLHDRVKLAQFAIKAGYCHI